MKADYARTGSWVIDNGLNGNGTVFQLEKVLETPETVEESRGDSRRHKEV